MDKSLAKNAVEQVKKELENERMILVKGMIKATLEAIVTEKEIIKQHERRLKALKQDMADIEAGKLNQFKERYQKASVSRINIKCVIPPRTIWNQSQSNWFKLAFSLLPPNS